MLGHSYGGAVAMAWGLEYEPAALVVVSGATIPWSGGLGAQYRLLGSSLGGAIIAPIATAFATRSRIDTVTEAIFEPQPVPEGYLDYVGPGLTLKQTAIRANARQVNNLHEQVSEMAPATRRSPCRLRSCMVLPMRWCRPRFMRSRCTTSFQTVISRFSRGSDTCRITGPPKRWKRPSTA